MYEFSYTIRDPIGLHARPAGMLSSECRKYKSAVMVEKYGQAANALGVMALMRLAIRGGDTIVVRIEGEDEDEAGPAVEAFFSCHL